LSFEDKRLLTWKQFTGKRLTPTAPPVTAEGQIKQHPGEPAWEVQPISSTGLGGSVVTGGLRNSVPSGNFASLVLTSTLLALL
jgi:hypothetical protein